MTTFQIYEDYTPPPWSSRPVGKYYLEIIKEGVQVSEQAINEKAMYLIGKHQQICDIVLENPTVSRKHAVLQFKNTGEVFVFDLASTHGTFVNNVKIPSRLFHKLKPFDQVKFGSSQRVYVVRCPEQEAEDAKQQEEEIEARLERKKARKDFRSLKDHYLSLLLQDPQYAHMRPRKQQNEEGISWGISDEYEVYRYQQEQEYPLEPDILRQLPSISTVNLDRIQKYADKLQVYRVAQAELDEVLKYEKNNFGLDEQRQVKKGNLEVKVEEIGAELERLEQGLRFSLFGDKSKREVQFEYKDSSEDDEFYDCTLKKEAPSKEVKKVEQTTESFADLKTQLEQLTQRRGEIQSSLLNLKQGEEQTVEDEDEFDVFMKQTAKNLAAEERPKLIKELQEIQNKIDSVTGQLKQVKPDIPSVFFDEEQVGSTDQKEQIKCNIKDKLKELQKMQVEPVVEEELDEEKILERAARDIRRQEEAIARKLKEQEYNAKRNKPKVKEASSDEDKVVKKVATTKPHSRHYKESEVEQEQFVDIVKFF